MILFLRILPFFARFQASITRGWAVGTLIRMLILSITLITIPFITNAQPVAADANEQQVKAAFLYKFLNYVEWPASAFDSNDAPYVIGVMDNNEIADTLSNIATGRRINNRLVIVKKLHAGDPLNHVHMVFIDDDDKARLPQLLKKLPMQVLSVTESDGALAQGSMINFRLSENKVRFEIALDAAEQAGLKLSSRLLVVAISVKGTQK
jgi:hypothetical protein